MSEDEKQKQKHESVSTDLSYGINSQNLDSSAIGNWGNGSNGREELTQEMGDDVFAARRARQAESVRQPGKVEQFLRAIGAKALGKLPGRNK